MEYVKYLNDGQKPHQLKSLFYLQIYTDAHFCTTVEGSLQVTKQEALNHFISKLI